MSSKVSINLWLLIAGIIFFCLAIVGVGLGVYYGTRPPSSVEPPETTTTHSGSSVGSSQTITTTTPRQTTPTPPDIRLPTNLYPTDYYLSIQTYLPSPSGSVIYDSNKNFTFDGNVSITIICSATTNLIVMQMHQIDIQEVILLDSNDAEIQLATHNETYNNHTVTIPYMWDSVTQKVTFTLASGQLTEGNTYHLHIRYIGILNDVLAGFYRSSYEEYGITK